MDISEKINRGFPIIVLELGDPEKFERQGELLISRGYRLHSSSCGFVQSERYDFCSSYHGIFLKSRDMEMIERS